jgi:hypothetical protein
VLAAIAAVRGAKAVHPHGVVYEARLRIAGSAEAPSAAELLRSPGEHLAIVRFSRALGLPRPLPDLLGLAPRVVDAYGPGRHQDVLATSSVDLPVLHHGFVPAADVQHRSYSSSLPYTAGGRRFLLGVVPVPRRRGRPGGTSSTGSRAPRPPGGWSSASPSRR